jgi:hypothetical protein
MDRHIATRIAGSSRQKLRSNAGPNLAWHKSMNQTTCARLALESHQFNPRAYLARFAME